MTDGALDYDCMTLLGMPLDAARHAFGWGALRTFARHLPETSAVFRARHPEEAGFASAFQGAAMMADLIDVEAAFAHMFAKAFGGKGPKPKPYPRPGKRGDVRLVGAGAIPISDFDEWYYGGD